MESWNVEAGLLGMLLQTWLERTDTTENVTASRCEFTQKRKMDGVVVW